MWGSGRGAGRGLGEGPCAGAAPPLRAAQPPPSPPGAAASTSAPPSPSQSGDTALDDAKEKGHTEVKLLEKCTPAYFAAQVGHPATRRAAPSLVHNPPRLIAVPRERYLGAYLLLSTHTAHHSLRIQANSNPEGAGRL